MTMERFETSPELVKWLEDARHNRLEGYRLNPRDLEEHANIETRMREGGYQDRQIYELVQNGADAIETGDVGRIELVLADGVLYCANTGEPLDQDGIETLLASHLSRKRQDQIGRFGLGFKSMLGISNRQEIYSLGMSILFDAQLARREVVSRSLGTKDTAIPSMRLAWPLTVQHETQYSKVKDELGEWASTIIRAAVDDDDSLAKVRTALEEFPPEFLLFNRSTIVLVLRDDDNAWEREISVAPDDDTVLVTVTTDGESTSTRWKRFERVIELSEGPAKKDAGQLHDRDRIPLIWAVPIDRSPDSGTFWAFFPLLASCRVPGIFNAPWKINDDRTGLLPGAYNELLADTFAEMIVEHVLSLRKEDDPGSILDYLPRRDGGDKLSEHIAEKVWEFAAKATLVPDATGEPRLIGELLDHPIDDQALLATWCELAPEQQLQRHVHPTALAGRDRKARVRQLRERANALPEYERSYHFQRKSLRTSAARAWMEAPAATEPQGAKAVVLWMADVFEIISRSDISEAPVLAKAILGDDDDLHAAREQGFYLQPEGPISRPGGIIFAHHTLCDDEPVREALARLGVRVFEDESWAAGLLGSLPGPTSDDLDACWRDWWEKVHAASAGAKGALFESLKKTSSELHAHNFSGEFVPLNDLLLAGEWFPDDDARREGNQPHFVDTDYHSAELAQLQSLGLCRQPSRLNLEAAGGVHRVPYMRRWHGDYLKDALEQWCREQRKRYHDAKSTGDWRNRPPAPQTGYISVLSKCASYRPIQVLEHGDEEAREQLTSFLLASADTNHYREIEVGHRTRKSAYFVVSFCAPLPWSIYKHGLLRIEGQTVRVSSLLAARDIRNTSISSSFVKHIPLSEKQATQLENLAHAVRALTSRSVYHPTDNDDPIWRALAQWVRREEVCEEDRREYFRQVLGTPRHHGTVMLSGKEYEISNMFVTGSRELEEQASKLGAPVLWMPSSALDSSVKAGAKKLEGAARLVVDRPSDPVDICEAFPEIPAAVEGKGRLGPLQFAFCSGLRLEFPTREQKLSFPRTYSVEDGILFAVRPIELNRGRFVDSMLAWLHAKGHLDIGYRTLSDINAGALFHRKQEIAQQPTLASRLLATVGGQPNALMDRLVAPLRAEVEERNVPPLRVAELFIATHGPTSLQELQGVLDTQGFRPPSRWTGRGAALSFVRDLGFPDEYAGGSCGRRDDWETVPGPTRLPDLHDFQQALQADLRQVLEGQHVRPRAVLSLPTGAGKTRVTVQALVHFVLSRDGSPLVLWLAQQDELCEQAVQSFQQVWAAEGREGIELRVSRLWGGIGSRISELQSGPQVVVATIQTLNNRFGYGNLAWLSQPDAVVIDEAHRGITPSYTSLLRWLEELRPETMRKPNDESIPILGLSATPFRGFDDDESQRLANRFGGRLIPGPSEQVSIHQRLQDKGILARVRHELLEIPVPFAFSPAEIEEILRFSLGRFPESASRRLGEDRERNKLIIDRILSLPAGSQILVFANTVEHAHLLAGLLNLEGRRAAAISGDTRFGLRQQFIEEFKSGEIKVLTNYGVLTTGFDAPKVDVLMIARPTFSPGLYQQMVGRGLRGPKNGGKEHCQLITVLDNLVRYGDQLAFHHFLRYFEGEEAQSAVVPAGGEHR